MKSIRTWVYAVLTYKDKIVVIEKKRGPFTGMYDLPWGKIEHWEGNVLSLQREVEEEIWLKSNEFNIEKLLTVEEDYTKHVWQGEQKDEHIIGIVYEVQILVDKFDMKYTEKWWDAAGFILMDRNDTDLPKTNILKKALEKFNENN